MAFVKRQWIFCLALIGYLVTGGGRFCQSRQVTHPAVVEGLPRVHANGNVRLV
jgi:hypothetical protein